MRRTAAVIAGAVVLSASFTAQAVAAPAEIVAPNARAAAEVDSKGGLERQKNVVDSFAYGPGVYCVIVDQAAGINLSTALILANGGPGSTSVSTIGKPTTSCGSRRDAVTVVTLKDGLPAPSSFTLAIL
ncbi:hypothetical protein ACFRAR_22505 [Kitasatospora sp. NPDC056651]|uniref:hypothetical protein n=1 Tax=Kitasatospora sp. NPDC056651 TaxID=3345892 RepID=UPI0036BDDECA